MHVDEFDDFLSPLAAERGAAVKAWLGSTLKDCVACGQPIRVMDGHELRKDGLAHRTCPIDAEAEKPDAPLSIGMQARAMRADW